MNKRDLAILEAAFAAEVNGALCGGPGIYQTRAKRAAELVDEGFLERATEQLPCSRGGSVLDRIPITVSGYRLTHAGRFAYCSTC